MRNNVLLLLVLHVVSLNAQFFDSFNDGDFVANPKWLGNNTLFTVDAQNKLRLNAPAGGVAYLYTQLVYPDSFTAEFELQLEFNPSASNFARVYFAAESANPVEGRSYFVQAGENGSLDALRLYRSENGQTTLLASGKEGALASDPAAARVKITFNKEGQLSCKADYDFNGSYEDTFTALDPSFNPSSFAFFGVECTFTASRKDKFVFDNLGIKALIADTRAPSALEASIKDNNRIEIVFDEPVTDISALKPTNYLLSGALRPNALDFNGSNDRILLTFNQGLPDEDTLLLSISGITDLVGNITSQQILKLIYRRAPKPGELVLSEILFDPFVNHSDFIEVFNAGNKALYLDSLRITNGLSGQAVWLLDKQPLLPGTFRAYTPNVSQLVETYRVDFNAEVFQQGLPAFNNDKGNITIATSRGILLDSFTYTAELHTLDEGENPEGVSLEKAHLSAFENVANWVSGSAVSLSASPGSANVVSLDKTAPSVIKVQSLSNTSVRITLDDIIRIPQSTAFRIYEDLQGELVIRQLTIQKNVVELYLASSLLPISTYQLTINGLNDKNGNTLRDTIVTFAFGDNPQPGNLVLSEVLFYPPTGISDFVEVYNATQKNLQLQGVVIVNEDNGQSDSIAEHYILPAGHYVAISSDTLAIKSAYPCPPEAQFLENELPALNADVGILQLFNTTGDLLDSFAYSEERHHVLIDKVDRKGVSLEKIVLQPFENNPFNWASSSQAGAYASPGYQNSNYFSGVASEEMVSLPKKIFSPNQDGQDDLLVLQYSLQKGGFVASLDVYSSDGYKVKNLTNNELLGQTGIITWDGTNDHGKPEMLGIYIITGTLFHPDGQVIRVKKDCVLADFID